LLETVSDDIISQLKDKVEDHFSNQKYESSIQYFDKLIGHYIDEIEHCGWRAHGLLKDEKKEKATAYFDKIEKLEPELYKFREQKAQVLEKLGKSSEAQLLLEKNKNGELF